MKFAITLLFCLSSLILLIEAAGYKKGVARVMSDDLEKRDKATWFDGGELDDAYCFGRDGLPDFHAKDSQMIGAMNMRGLEQCFKCMEIRNNRQKNKKVIVQIIDKCGSGCELNKHIDLTKSAFKKLDALVKGELDISFKPVSCPGGGVFDLIKKLRNK